MLNAGYSNISKSSLMKEKSTNKNTIMQYVLEQRLRTEYYYSCPEGQRRRTVGLPRQGSKSWVIHTSLFCSEE